MIGALHAKQPEMRSGKDGKSIEIAFALQTNNLESRTEFIGDDVEKNIKMLKQGRGASYIHSF